MTKTLQNY